MRIGFFTQVNLICLDQGALAFSLCGLRKDFVLEIASSIYISHIFRLDSGRK